MNISDLSDFILKDKGSAHLRCKHKGLINQVLELTNFLDDYYDCIPWKQRFWHIINNQYKLQLCDICQKPSKFGSRGEYLKTCSPECDKIYRKNVFIKKYGVDNFSRTKQFKEKLISSNNSNFGVDNPIQSDVIQEKHKRNYIKKVQEKLGNDYKLISYGETLKFTHKICGNTTEILRNTFNKRHNVYGTTHCIHCNPFNSNTSESEKDLVLFIQSIYHGTTETHNRNIILPYELDIYLPDLKLAFEFDGDYYHTTKYVKKHYHKMKSDLCEQKDIKLVHIWEHKWKTENDKVCDTIKTIINKINPLKHQQEGIIFNKETSTYYINRDYWNLDDVKELSESGFKVVDFQLDYWYCQNSCDILTKDNEPNIPSGYHRCYNSGVYILSK